MKRNILIILLGQLIAMAYAGYVNYLKQDYYVAKVGVFIISEAKESGDAVKEEEEMKFYADQKALILSELITKSAKQRALKNLSIPPPLEFSVSLTKENSVIGSAVLRLTAKSTYSEYAISFLDEVTKEFIAYKRKLRKPVENPADAEFAKLVVETATQKQRYEKAEGALFEFQIKHDMSKIEKEINSLKQEMAALKHGIEVKNRLDQMEQLKKEYNRLNAEVSEAKKAFEDLNKRVNEIPIGCPLKPDWIGLVGKPSTQWAPPKPSKFEVIVRASIMGLACSLSLILALSIRSRAGVSS